MLNKDFLRQILKDDKSLLKLSDVSPVHMPKYDELSVKNLYAKFKHDKEFMSHFPDHLPQGKLPDRQYFFNILNTLHEDYTQQLLKHAADQRFKGHKDKMGYD